MLGSQNGLNALKDQWKLPEVQSTFEHVKQSYGANADLSESVSVPSHGWVERARKAKKITNKSGSDVVEESGTIITDDDISRVVVEFRKTHPGLKLETHDDDHSIHVQSSHPWQTSPFSLYDRFNLFPALPCSSSTLSSSVRQMDVTNSVQNV